MPLYVYYCEECQLEIEEIRPFSMADVPMVCPACGSQCRKTPSLFATLGSQAKSLTEQTLVKKNRPPSGLPMLHTSKEQTKCLNLKINLGPFPLPF